jgi:hypothetical protein
VISLREAIHGRSFRPSTEKARLCGVSNLRVIPDAIRVLHAILAERRRLDKPGRGTIVDQILADGSLVRAT